MERAAHIQLNLIVLALVMLRTGKIAQQTFSLNVKEQA